MSRGKIIPKSDSIVVTIQADQLVQERAWFRPPGDKYEKPTWYDYIGNFIARVAWRMIYLKAPKHMKNYNAVKIEGEGTFTITFYNEEGKQLKLEE